MLFLIVICIIALCIGGYVIFYLLPYLLGVLLAILIIAIYFISTNIKYNSTLKRYEKFINNSEPDEEFINIGNVEIKKNIVKYPNTQYKIKGLNITIRSFVLEEIKIVNKVFADLLLQEDNVDLQFHKPYTIFEVVMDMENFSNDIITIEHNKSLAVNNLKEQTLKSKALGEKIENKEVIMPNAIQTLNYCFLFQKSKSEDIKEIKFLIPTINEYITITL